MAFTSVETLRVAGLNIIMKNWLFRSLRSRVQYFGMGGGVGGSGGGDAEEVVVKVLMAAAAVVHNNSRQQVCRGMHCLLVRIVSISRCSPTTVRMAKY